MGADKRSGWRRRCAGSAQLRRQRATSSNGNDHTQRRASRRDQSARANKMRHVCDYEAKRSTRNGSMAHTTREMLKTRAWNYPPFRSEHKLLIQFAFGSFTHLQDIITFCPILTWCEVDDSCARYSLLHHRAPGTASTCKVTPPPHRPPSKPPPHRRTHKRHDRGLKNLETDQKG